MLGEVKTTVRGFEIVTFTDAYGLESSLQQSSAIGDSDVPGASFIWLGVSLERMHLSREQVFNLIQLLTKWYETGSFK